MAAVDVTDNHEASRYEARLEGQLAGFAEYAVAGPTITFLHTQVLPDFDGMGVGSALVRGALDDVRARGRGSVVPVCPFVRGWIDRHPDYADLKA